MKKYLLLSVGLLIASCANQGPVGIGETASSTVAVTADQWNALTQSQKDMTIFSVAVASIGNNSPNCKEAARTIVSTANGGAVNLPSTNADGKSWAPYSRTVNRNVTNIASIGTMDILQIYYYAPSNPRVWEPHTAIVVSKNATSMTWIDGNYVSPGTIVGQHTVTFSQFNNWINPGVNPPAGKSAGFTAYHVQ